MKAISVNNVSKKFLLKHDRPRSIADGVQNLFRRKKREVFWALKDINFEVEQGEALGMIGHNGAGKSTMLKLLTRIMEPTTGQIHTRGRVSALIEVGAGFHPEMTGRENIYLNGSILGMTQMEVTKKLDSIIAFAELEKFIDTPVKRYSSGMYARLGFSVAAHVDPDILIVDEVLSVGDTAFQDRCSAHMAKLRKSGTTILFVSHNLSAISAICDRVVVLNRGEINGICKPMEAIALYREQMVRGQALTIGDEPSPVSETDSPLVIKDVISSGPTENKWDAYTGESWEMRVAFECSRVLDSPEIGFKLFSPGGVELARPSTIDYGVNYEAGIGKHEVVFRVDKLPLQPGNYVVEIFAYDKTGAYPYDSLKHIYQLAVLPGKSGYKTGVRFGSMVLCGDWSLDNGVSQNSI